MSQQTILLLILISLPSVSQSLSPLRAVTDPATTRMTGHWAGSHLTSRGFASVVTPNIYASDARLGK